MFCAAVGFCSTTSEAPARRSQIPIQKRQPILAHMSQLIPAQRSKRANPSAQLRCPSSQIPAHTSSRVPIQRPQLRNHGIQPLRCWGASTAYGSDSSHSAAAELTRAMAITGGHGMVGTALRHAILHMRRRHFALGAAHRARQKVAKAVMAGARANKFQLAVTLRGTSGATGLRPLSLAWRDAMEQGGTARRAFHELLHCRHERIPPLYSSGQSAR